MLLMDRIGRATTRRGGLCGTRVIAALAAAGAMFGMTAVTATQLAGNQQAAAAPDVSIGQGVSAGGQLRYSVPPLPDVPVGVPVRWPDGDGASRRPSSGPAAARIPARVLAAYRNAVGTLERRLPGCGLRTPLLAAIGRVESGHARGGHVDASGRTVAPILGPRLDGGPGVRAIRDTDGGSYDSDTVWDRAVGSMQFIPSTWRRWGADGNGDGTADPHNIDDAALAAGRYLCAAGGELRDPDGLRRAVLAYNRSEDYLRLVLSWMRVYAGEVVAVESSPRRSSASGSPQATPRPSRSAEQAPSRDERAAAHGNRTPATTTSEGNEPGDSEPPDAPEPTAPDLPQATTHPVPLPGSR